jgi:hypothetical protein
LFAADPATLATAAHSPSIDAVGGTPELRVANLAAQVIDASENDPAEFFEIEANEQDHYEDYGND